MSFFYSNANIYLATKISLYFMYGILRILWSLNLNYEKNLIDHKI